MWYLIKAIRCKHCGINFFVCNKSSLVQHTNTGKHVGNMSVKKTFFDKNPEIKSEVEQDRFNIAVWQSEYNVPISALNGGVLKGPTDQFSFSSVLKNSGALSTNHYFLKNSTELIVKIINHEKKELLLNSDSIAIISPKLH